MTNSKRIDANVATLGAVLHTAEPMMNTANPAGDFQACKFSTLRVVKPNSLRQIVVVAFSFALLVLAPWVTALSNDSGSGDAVLDKLNSVSRDAAQGKVDAFHAYEEILSDAQAASGSSKGYALQLLSMYDALNGRYDDAYNHYRQAFPTSPLISCPGADYEAVNLDHEIKKATQGYQVVVINESHSVVVTRATIYNLLPALYKMGYHYVAFEALALEENLNGQSRDAGTRSVGLRDHDLVKRGYPLDTNNAGFYLREPIFGEVIREAIKLGYGLVAYDPLKSKSKDDRETLQSSNLMKFISTHPREKLVVIGGYSHI
jgi:hypothetical protein